MLGSKCYSMWPSTFNHHCSIFGNVRVCNKAAWIVNASFYGSDEEIGMPMFPSIPKRGTNRKQAIEPAYS